MKIDDMIAAIQKKLDVQADGHGGPETWGAVYAALVKPSIARKAPGLAVAKVDDRSEANIATLLPEVQPIARALVQKAATAGIQIKVISGTRSYEEQDALYAQGRTAPGLIVTKARAGYSNHNFGIAFDIGVFEGRRYLPESPKYKAVGALGIDLGLEWGGSWKSLTDEPHFQLRPEWARDMNERTLLAGLREREAAGASLFA